MCERKAGIMIAGHGKMAEVLEFVCKEDPARLVRRFPNGKDDFIGEINPVAIHFGSGRELPELIQWCAFNDAPLIQGSSGQEYPESVSIPWILAPNLSLLMIRFLLELPALHQSLGDVKVTITESHQEGKQGVSGTAIAIAGILDIPKKNIISIRDKTRQRELGVPEAHLDGHGYHWVHFESQDVNITRSIRINGRHAYAEGALHIADALIRHRDKLEVRVYDVQETMEWNVTIA